jgi:hypothetical protein
MRGGDVFKVNRACAQRLCDASELNEVANAQKEPRLSALAKKHLMSIHELRELRAEFLAQNINGDGRLSLDEFKMLICRWCNLPDTYTLPPHLLNSELPTYRSINFEEVVSWVQCHGYVEEICVPDPLQRELRKVAREHGLDIPTVESLKQVFDNFDFDESGTIEVEEFHEMFTKLTGLSKHQDLDSIKKTLNRYWAEMDTDHSGTITFVEFVRMYLLETRSAGENALSTFIR